METDFEEQDWVGVRRVEAPRSTTFDLTSVQTGVALMIVAHLEKHHPSILGRVLSTRCPFEAIKSRYIASLMAPKAAREGLWSSPRRKTPSVKEKARKRARDESPAPKDNSNRQDNRIWAPAFRMEEALSANDDVFLADILEEYGEERNTSFTGVGCVLPVTTVCMDDASQGSQRATNGSEKHDLLNWLKLEIERDWQALAASNPCLVLPNREQQYSYNSRTEKDWCDHRGEYRYKCSISIGSRKCDLGTFETATLAAMAYNCAACARRTIAIKLLEECDARKMIQSRRASYMEMKRAAVVRGITPDEASLHAEAASIRAFRNPKVAPFWTSEVVLRPKLNVFKLLEFEPPSTPPLRDCLIHEEPILSPISLSLLLDDLVSEDVVRSRAPSFCTSDTEERSTELDGVISRLELRHEALSEKISLAAEQLKRAVQSTAL